MRETAQWYYTSTTYTSTNYTSTDTNNMKSRLQKTPGNKMDQKSSNKKTDSSSDYVVIGSPHTKQRKSTKNVDIQLKHDSLRRIASIKKIYLDDDGKLFRDVEVYRTGVEPLGICIRWGDGVGGEDGIFISRVTLGSLVDEKNLIHAGDEITHVNGVGSLMLAG